MKIFTLAAIVAALSTTSVSANDTLKNTAISVTAVSDALDFSIDGTRDGVTDIEVGVSMFDYNIGLIATGARFALGTDLNDAIYTSGEYAVRSDINADISVYGTAAIQYDSNTKFENGLWSFAPSAAIEYDITDQVTVFTEVGYTWGLNQGRDDLGGSVEVGFPVSVSNGLDLTPSVTRSFRTDANETTTALNITYQF